MKTPKNITNIFSDDDADELGVKRFAKAMNAKLSDKRAQGKYGWNKPDDCTIAYLRRLLETHVEKGDPVDIANFAMMIWNREHPTGSCAPETEETS
jgi:hypothetical protein